MVHGKVGITASLGDDGVCLEYPDDLVQEEIEEIVHEEVIGDIESGDDMNYDDPNAVYYCTSCGVGFCSVAEHLLEYHQHVPVVVEVMNSTDAAPLQSVEYNYDDLIEEVYHDVSESETVETWNVDQQKTCSICQTVFGSKQRLRIHMRMHSPPKPQIIALTSGVDNQLRCAECGETFPKENAAQHAETHRGKEHNLCTICNRRFSSNDVLLMHMQSHQVCPTVVKRKLHKESTLKRTKSDRKLTYPCQYCGKEFYRPYEKVEHERIHTGEKPYPCQICGKSFRLAYCLTLHMRTHFDERPYTCERCQRSFSSNSAYAHHMLTHSEERNYECSFCGKTCKTLVHLTGHRKSHTRPFSCTECSRSFATLYALRNHMQLHQRLDKQAFACEICGATYGRHSSLRNHQREQHSFVMHSKIN